MAVCAAPAAARTHFAWPGRGAGRVNRVDRVDHMLALLLLYIYTPATAEERTRFGGGTSKEARNKKAIKTTKPEKQKKQKQKAPEKPRATAPPWKSFEKPPNHIPEHHKQRRGNPNRRN
eukprot:1094778-Prymnesium_polylepis.1